MANMTLRKKSVTQLITPLLFTLILSACTTAPNNVDILSSPSESSSSYILKADQELQIEKQADWLIMAVKASIEEGNDTLTNKLFIRLDNMQLSPIQEAEVQLIHAEWLKSNSAYTEALNQLNFQTSWRLNDEMWIHYHKLRHELYLITDDAINATRELIALEPFSYSNLEKTQLWSQVWSNLSSLNNVDLEDIQLTDEDEILKGWVELLTSYNTFKFSPVRLKSKINEWFTNNPTHPATLYTPQDLEDILNLDLTPPERIAILLPLSGNFKEPASRIRDGFLKASELDQIPDKFTTLKVIDTDSMPMNDIINTLIADQIQFVVGPLDKRKVKEFQELNNSNIPELALNIPVEINSNKNSCYFTLSPEQEVEQGAIHLFNKGYRYPLFLSPEGKMGSRLTKAFNDKWMELTNRKASTRYFQGRKHIEEDVSDIFGLDESKRRASQLRNMSGLYLHTDPRSRRDTDAIYMVASPSELTLFRPFINVAINPGIKVPPVYANSRSNNGSKTQLTEITGIEYSDIPMLTQQAPDLKKQLKEFWPSINSNEEFRFYALGMDAYQLISELPHLQAIDDLVIESRTGRLNMDNQECIIQRQLSWGIHN